MIKIICGKYGPRSLGPGTTLNLDKKTEARLVNRGVAVYLNEPNSGSDDSVEGGGIKLKTEDELKKLKSKKELIKYAESIGQHDLEESNSKEKLISAILDYQEENFTED